MTLDKDLLSRAQGESFSPICRFKIRGVSLPMLPLYTNLRHLRGTRVPVNLTAAKPISRWRATRQRPGSTDVEAPRVRATIRLDRLFGHRRSPPGITSRKGEHRARSSGAGTCIDMRMAHPSFLLGQRLDSAEDCAHIVMRCLSRAHASDKDRSNHCG